MIVLGLLLFAFLVIIHEFGHFIAARRNGVEVEEFGIGFPPRLFGRKHKGTLYSFNLLPLGGFVRLKGEHDAASTAGSFGAASLGAKTKIILAGVAMNVVAVYVLFLLLSLVGLPQIIENQFSVKSNERVASSGVAIAAVQESSAAASTGLKSGDVLLRINEQPVTSSERLKQLTGENSGQEINLTYLHSESEQTKSVRLGTDEEIGHLGVVPVDLVTVRYTWAAPLVALGLTWQVVALTVAGIFTIFKDLFIGNAGQVADSVAGPIGLFFMLQNAGNFGYEYLLVLVATISASLAVFNALPIPALDGGRLAVIMAARALKKPLTPAFENLVNALGFIVLIGLIILISFIDAKRFF